MTDAAAPRAATFQPPPFPQTRTCPYQPPAAYGRLREEGPLRRVTLYGDRPAWLVTRFGLARRLLADPRLSSDRDLPNFPVLSPEFEALRRNRPLRLFIGMDPPEHSRQRRQLIGEFTVTRIRAMRGDIKRIVHESIDGMLAAGPPVDLVRHFALPVPSMVICRLLGVPYEDRELFQNASRRLLLSDPEGTLAARQELLDYLDRLVAARERRPGPGVLGRLAARLGDGRGGDEALTRADLVSIGLLLLVAGHETTASAISLGVITLLDHPEQLAALRADPDAAPQAVEELLRYLSIVDITGVRIATADIEVDGQTVRAGESVIVPQSIPNRDRDAFPYPDTFDIGRSARHHLAFGYGAHQCLGQNLARLELEVAVPALFARIPTLRLAIPADRLALRPASTVQGVNELPVAW